MVRYAFLFSLGILLLTPFVLAGITPGKYEVDYVPGQKSAFPFSFVSSDPNARFEISLQGDFAHYAQLSDSIIQSSGNVITYVTMPAEVEVPGLHKIIVIGSEISQGGGLGISGEARGLIFIHVPYPGQYLEATLRVENVNEGEPVSMLVTVINRGKETTNADVSIDIYHEETFIERVSLGQVLLEPAGARELTYKLDTESYSPGFYEARARVGYGEKETRVESSFRIGTLAVQLINYTRFLERDTINRLDLDVESAWNSPISSVFANVSILGSDLVFITPTAALEPFGRATLAGFFDTTGLEEPIQARVVLLYEQSSSESLIELRYVRETNYALILGIIIGVLLLVGIVIWVRRARTGRKR